MANNSEFGFIEHIKSIFDSVGDKNIEGIGDDCAIIPIGDNESMVITTDILVEGVHFLSEAISAYDLARKSLAVNLSDIAAMGAKPTASLLSIALPKEFRGEWAKEFIDGYKSLSSEHQVKLIGGDTSSSLDKIVINIVAMGKIKNNNIKRRSSAKIGDDIYVVGKLGASHEGLKDILKGEFNTSLAKIHNSPRAQIEEGLFLGSQNEVNAMMDLSDGLASDLNHILKASDVDAIIDLDKIAFVGNIESAVCGGEDYKLLFTASSDNFMANYQGETIYKIGQITKKAADTPKIIWKNQGQEVDVNWKGYTHF